jgi:hypothetical protein
MPLTHVLRYLDCGEVYIFALTSSSSPAVQAVQGNGTCQSSVVLLPPPTSVLFNYTCDSLM